MEKKIGLLELKAHHEVLRAYLLGFTQVDVQLYVYTNSFNYDLQKDLHDSTHIQWRLIQTNQSNDQFIDQHREEITSLDFLLITTIFPLTQKTFPRLTKTGILIHAWHFLFRPQFQFLSKIDLDKLPLRLLKMPLTWYRRHQMKQWISQIDTLIVGAQSVYDYLKHSKTPTHRPFYLLEMYVNESLTPVHSQQPTTIVVPGNISTSSRDYELLYRVFHQLDTRLDAPIRLCFAGVVKTKYAKKIQQRFSQLSPKMETVFFDQYLNQEQYDQLLLTADFLLCPIKTFSYSGMIREWNGYSHLTANVNDVIRLGIPAIFPEDYPIPQNVQQIIGKYNSEAHLLMLLEQWINEQTFNHYKNKGIIHFQSYNLPNAKIRFKQFLNDIGLGMSHK